MCLSLFTLFSSHNDNTCHGTSTIYRCSRTVFKDLEALNIIRVKSCNSRTDKRFRITRSQIVSSHVRNILHNNAVYHPKRLRTTIDRGCSTYTNLRCRAESSTNVLNRNTCCLSFERTTNVCNTAQTCFRCIYFVGCTSKQSSVGFSQTSYHNV